MDLSYWKQWLQRGVRTVQNYWTPLLLGLLGTMIVLFVWQQAIVHERQTLGKLVEQQAETIKIELSQNISSYIKALEHIADRYSAGGGTQQALWERDVANYIKDFQVFQAIEWVDSSFQVQWTVPLKGNEGAKKLKLNKESNRQKALSLARDLHQTMLTHGVVLKQGGKGFLVSVPIYISSPSDVSKTPRFDGFIVGVFRFQKLFDKIFKATEGYKVQISDPTGVIYGQSQPLGLTKTVVVKLYGTEWRVQVFPTDTLMAKSHSSVPTIILWGGLVGVWSLVLSIALARRSQHYARQVAKKNQQLQQEIAQRHQVEANFEQIIAASPSLIYSVVKDSNGQIYYEYLSPAFEEIYEAPIKQALRNPSIRLNFIHPEDLAACKEAMDKSLVSVEVFYHQWRIITPSGKIKWVQAKSRPEKRKNGEIAWHGVLQDITEQRHIEQELALQAVITRNMGEGVCLLKTTNQIIVYTNPKFDEMFGYETGELMGQNISILNHATERVSAEDINKEILKRLQRGQSSFELHNVKKDGTPVWCNVTISQFNHPEYGAVLVTVNQDITAHKEAQEALQQRAIQEKLLLRLTQAIRKHINLLEMLNTAVTEIRQTLEADRVAIYRFNPDWSGYFLAESVTLDWLPLVEFAENKKIWQDTYLQETEGGRFQKQQILVVPDIYKIGLQPCHIQLLEQFQAKAYIITPIFLGVNLWGLLAIYQNDKPRHWQAWEIELLQQIVSQLEIAIGQADLYQQLEIELAERQVAELALRQAKEAAEAANSAKSTFLANMSHEFRTPLNVILGFTQVMANDPLLPPSHQENLETIRRSGDLLLLLINDILDLSKIEAGHYKIETQAFDLIALLNHLRTMFSEWIKSKNLWFTVDMSPEVPQFIISDPQRLHQILLNLLSNAIKFTQRGGISLSVALAEKDILERSFVNPITQPDLILQFAVTDTGIGIAAAEQNTIFEAFVQAPAQGVTYGGTGLGLTISKKLLNLMGGEISLQSIVGEGSTFIVTLPVHVTSQPKAALEQYNRRVIGLVPNQPTRRLLVVDDQPNNRLLLVKLLSKLGLEVREASNGVEAVEMWQQWHPDLIWMDLRMPIMDGYEATKQIRAQETQGQETIIIALTAQASEPDRSLSLAIGCNDFISKPFREQTLLLKMTQYLGLEYIYTESDTLPTDGASPMQMSEEQQVLTTLPSEWLKELENAAVCGHDGTINELIKQISPLQPQLANYLGDLANNFQFEQILQLLQP